MVILISKLFVRSRKLNTKRQGQEDQVRVLRVDRRTNTTDKPTNRPKTRASYCRVLTHVRILKNKEMPL